MLLSVLLTAEASYFVGLGEEITMPTNGTFHRSAPRGDDGWWFFIGAGGSYVAFEADKDHGYDDRERLDVAERDDLVDRAITKCPDGTWFIAGSGNFDDFNDSVWVFKADAELNKTNEDTVAESSSERQHNDMALVCSSVFSGVSFLSNSGGSDLFEVDSEGSIIEQHHLSDTPGMMGGSMIALEDTGELVLIGRGVEMMSSEIEIGVYDEELQRISSKSVELMAGRTERVWWPQSILKVGDIFLLAYMARIEANGDFPADEGEVWLAVLDSNFDFVESIQVTDLAGSGAGAMRPGLSRRGETLTVSYDVQVSPRLREVTLDLTGAHVPGDSGDPQDYGDETGDGSDDSGEDGGGGGICGCTTGGLGGTGLALGATLLLWARRQR